MPTGWYISLHTIGIRSHLLAYGRFDFSMYVGDTPPQIILYTSKCTQIFMHSPSLHHYSLHCSYILGTLLYFIAKYLYSITSNCSFFDNGAHTTINLYSMDLHEDNPVSAETSLPLLDHSILDVLEFTPVCVVCKICNRPITGNVRSVRHHMSKHYTIPDGTSFRIGNQLQLGMEHAKQENVATLLQGTEERARMLYECVDCKTLIDTKKKIEEHQSVD